MIIQQRVVLNRLIPYSRLDSSLIAWIATSLREAGILSRWCVGRARWFVKRRRESGWEESVEGFGFRERFDEWLGEDRRNETMIVRQEEGIRGIGRKKECLNWVSISMKWKEWVLHSKEWLMRRMMARRGDYECMCYYLQYGLSRFQNQPAQYMSTSIWGNF